MVAKKGFVTQKVHCNACRQVTNHNLLKTVSTLDSDDDHGISWGTQSTMLECRGCNEIVLRRESWFSEDPDSKITFFPPRASRWLPNWQSSLPRPIRELLSEVYTALQADSLSLAMMGARAIIETAMIKKVDDYGKFADTLAAMQDEGYLSFKNRQYLEVALDAGSASMHRAHCPDSKQMNTVMDIVENFLLSLFGLEKQTAALRDAIPPRPAVKKKATVAKKL